MDFHLAREMEVLGSDAMLRRRNIENLFSTLTAHEIRLLGRYVAQTDFRTDIFGRLPIELRLHVAEYVEDTDIINFLNVSKTWREAWSQIDMMNLLMPSFVEYHRRKDEIASSDLDLQDLFYRAAARLRVRGRGKYRSLMDEMAPYKPGHGAWHPENNFVIDPEYHQPNEHGKIEWLDLVNKPSGLDSQSLLYCDGRVAWQPFIPESNHSLIVVDNLRNQLRKAYTIPGAVIQGGISDLEALGNKLVVASLDRTLHAWDLETNEHCSVVLPSRGFYCQTYGHRVYIHPAGPVSREPGKLKIYTWTFKGPLRELDIVPLLMAIQDQPQQDANSLCGYCAGTIPHPLLDETVFVVFEVGSTISLHRYTQGAYSATLSFNIPMEDGFCIQRNFCKRLTRVNSQGKYAVAVLGRHTVLKPVSYTKQSFRIVCFDTIAQRFSVENYPIPVRGIRTPLDFTWWDSQLTAFRIGTQDDWGVMRLVMAPKTTDSAMNLGDRIIEVPIHSDDGSLRRVSLDWSRRRPNQRQVIFADENFIVIGCELSRGYLALSFWTEFRKSSPQIAPVADQDPAQPRGHGGFSRA